ncbi:MAG: methoxyneurosporene dehydrogenase, partial [Rhodobacteraceae bacterium]|nr:methoxyneurosporene dehydrogenase [Paracoccaceae bacterium]
AEAAEILIKHGRAAGVRLTSGERIEAAAVIAAGDAAALGAGKLGNTAAAAATPPTRGRRSLSAVVWTGWARAEGFPLAHHNVFFPEDYRAEFEDVFNRRRTPRRPTVYACAQDRLDGGAAPLEGVERLQLLVNAPADGDLAAATAPGGPLSESEIDQCEMRMTALLAECGLSLAPPPAAQQGGASRWERTGPAQFEQLFPGTGGALYGPANHGPMGTFQRPGGRTAIPGLHLAGGSTHPGPGAPMAALSGRQAAARVMAEQG